LKSAADFNGGANATPANLFYNRNTRKLGVVVAELLQGAVGDGEVVFAINTEELHDAERRKS
jgi:predicted ATP-dependent Lon-type protease